MMTMRAAFTAVVMLITFGLCAPAPRADAGERIAVLIGSSEPPFEEALAGFQGYLAKQGIEAEYEIHRFTGDASQAEQAAQKSKKGGARLIFTLGSVGTEAAVKKAPDIPVVACLVLRSDSLARTPNATGVGLEFPLEVQFNWLRTMLPDAETVGVIYNPDENGKRVEAAARIARGLGLTLVAQEARTPQDVPSALNTLSKSVDVLWGLADNLVLSPQIAKHVLLFSFRNSIPFIGPSSAWAKAGALYSLDWDYRDLGVQCGEMALRVLQGAQPSAIPPAAPRKVLYSINLKTARQIKITISEQLAKKARNIY